MISDPRPVSPHLQIYRWQLTSVLSILHRITGIALVVGAVLLVSWFGSAADGPASFASFQGFLGSPIGLILLFGCSVALFYHLCNGIRHLCWDTGRGLELKTVYASGWTVLVATAVLTVIVWGVGLSRWGF
jgi:succinate dehydrogenase / fumarate reductase, cytochrome b subunit